MKIILLAFIVLSNFEMFAQTPYNPFIGVWVCYHLELEDGNTGEDFTFDGTPYSCDSLTLELKDDFSGTESSGGLTFTYEFQDSLLRLGNRLYIVEFISNTELVLKEYDPDGLSLSIFRQKFRKKTRINHFSTFNPPEFAKQIPFTIIVLVKCLKECI